MDNDGDDKIGSKGSLSRNLLQLIQLCKSNTITWPEGQHAKWIYIIIYNLYLYIDPYTVLALSVLVIYKQLIWQHLAVADKLVADVRNLSRYHCKLVST